MKIYVARHGETDYNIRQLVNGVTDLPLTERGICQAQRLAENVKSVGDIDIIVASPLQRASATAEIVADMLGKKVIVEKQLHEWDYGDFEGKSRFDKAFIKAKTDYCRRMPGGESLLMMSHRIYSVLDKIIADFSPNNVLLVCHGGIARIITTYFQDVTSEQMQQTNLENCQLLCFEIN